MAIASPNIVFILSDDHAAHAISAYGSRINITPNLDRIAAGGAFVEHCLCTNSICTPSRASILTGTYSHVNGATTLRTPLDSRLPTFVSQLHDAGYQTALFGKWHLGHGPTHDPVGFDRWEVLPGQGIYHNPEFLTPEGRIRREGYVTDVITDRALAWLADRDPRRPFCLLVHHKAPHRHWEPDAAHRALFTEGDVREPDTLFDDYTTRSEAAHVARMRLEDLTEADLKAPVPPSLSPREERRWRYQSYIADYLRVIASLDDNVGRLLDALGAQGLGDDTLVIYASDQGFFLGDHGWFDKRMMYEHSLHMPLLIRWPAVIAPGTRVSQLVTNVDLAPTLCDAARIAAPAGTQGRSMLPLLRGQTVRGWPNHAYYRYWMHDDAAHGVYAHYGIRTDRHKLICFYNDDLGRSTDRPPAPPGQSTQPRPPIAWELYDLDADPDELHNVVADPAYADVRADLVALLAAEQRRLGDEPYPGAVEALPVAG